MIIMELNYSTIGERIAHRRQQKGMKQRELAEKLNISNNYLSSIERGKESPSLEILVAICNELEVTPDYLIMGNMHANNIPQSITDNLRICSGDDLGLLSEIVKLMVNRNSGKWNSDNFV